MKQDLQQKAPKDATQLLSQDGITFTISIILSQTDCDTGYVFILLYAFSSRLSLSPVIVLL